MAAPSQQETAPLHAAVMAWADAWHSCSAQRLLALWDKADSQSWYLAANSVDPDIGPAVVGALQRRCMGVRAVTYRPKNIHTRLLSPDVGLAFFELSWAQATATHPIPSGGDVRVTMLLREVAGRWLAFHYAEAPLAPLLELQAYYERIAADGLDAIPPRAYVP